MSKTKNVLLSENSTLLTPNFFMRLSFLRKLSAHFGCIFAQKF